MRLLDAFIKDVTTKQVKYTEAAERKCDGICHVSDSLKEVGTSLTGNVTIDEPLSPYYGGEIFFSLLSPPCFTINNNNNSAPYSRINSPLSTDDVACKKMKKG